MTRRDLEKLIQEQLSQQQPNDELVSAEENADSVNHSASAYSYEADDGDEKIMPYDPKKPESESDVAELRTANVVISEAISDCEEITEENIDLRFSNMEHAISESVADPVEPTIDQTADEQDVESSKTPTHGLDEDFDSFADHPMTEAPSGEAPCAGDQCDAQLPIGDASDESENEEESKKSTFHSTSSVAELLAKMQAEGQWDGIPDDEGPEPIEAHGLHNEVNPVLDEVNPGLDPPAPPINGGEPDDDVGDYMSQLLNRMRGDDDPAPTIKQAVKEPVVEAEVKEARDEHEFVPPANPLKPDEFKPAQKAQKIELSALRELANTTSRNAVNKSEKIRRKEMWLAQVGIALFSCSLAVYFFLWNSQAFFDTGFLIGLGCAGLAGVLFFRSYATIRRNDLNQSAKEAGNKQES